MNRRLVLSLISAVVLLASACLVIFTAELPLGHAPLPDHTKFKLNRIECRSTELDFDFIQGVNIDTLSSIVIYKRTSSGISFITVAPFESNMADFLFVANLNSNKTLHIIDLSYPRLFLWFKIKYIFLQYGMPVSGVDFFLLNCIAERLR